MSAQRLRDERGQTVVEWLGGLVVLTVLPGGLGGALYAGRDRVLRYLARRRGLA
jgi:hypothetical protein